MLRRNFTVSLLGNVSIGSRGSIVGAKQGLSYLPGSVFLGAAAARLYTRLGDEAAWTVFHEGKLRFLDALPLTSDNKVAYPMPQSLHTEGKVTIGATPVTVNNFTHGHKDNGRRLKEGFLTSDYQVFKPETHICLKTAIDPRTGRAADSQLFGLHAIAAGGRFLFSLEADNNVSQAVFDQVVEALTGPLRLGTSRSAEYGRVKLEVTEISSPAHGEPNGRLLSLYCLADLACLDEHGQPVTCPTATELGLPPGDLVLEKSFLTHNCFTPFNAKWRRTEQERQVIGAGSVLCYELKREPNWTKLVALCNRGLGLYRQVGLGRVLVNPAVLQDKRFEVRGHQAAAPQAGPAQPDVPLAAWLLDRHLKDGRDREARETVDAWLPQLRLCYDSARLLAAEHRGVRVGPSPHQWGRVRELARDPGLREHPLKLFGALFEGDDAVCKNKDPDWCKAFQIQSDHGGMSHFRDWLREKLNKCETHKATTLAHLAREAMTLTRVLEEK